MSICQAQVQYLGHVIVGGVGMDGHVIVEGGMVWMEIKWMRLPSGHNLELPRPFEPSWVS